MDGFFDAGHASTSHARDEDEWKRTVQHMAAEIKVLQMKISATEGRSNAI